MNNRLYGTVSSIRTIVVCYGTNDLGYVTSIITIVACRVPWVGTSYSNSDQNYRSVLWYTGYLGPVSFWPWVISD